MGLLGELASLFRDPSFRSLAGQARCDRRINSFLEASGGGRGSAGIAGVEVNVLHVNRDGASSPVLELVRAMSMGRRVSRSQCIMMLLFKLTMLF